MNTKHALTILAFLAILSVAFALPQMDHSSLIDKGQSHLLNQVSNIVPVSNGHSIIEVEPFKPNQPKPSSPVGNSTLSTNNLNGSSRGSGLSANELDRVLNTSRVYDTINRKWSKFTWSPIQRENIVMSWTYRGDRMGVKRPSAGRLYYNKMK